MKIESGYRAFNGHVFTMHEAELYNHAYFANADERHRLFCAIIYPKEGVKK